jgi:tRNA U34 5-methylaminomethyl-2-thiouridine-forming methyltransferase MnmC
MKRELRRTRDGSHTLFVPTLNEHYHSIHGALQESLHVFVEAGLRARNEQKPAILEVGFGTGLNAWLTAIEAANTGLEVAYTALEKYPLIQTETAALGYGEIEGYEDHCKLFQELHKCNWEVMQPLTGNFSLCKKKVDLHDFETTTVFDLIYFDAFAPDAQPDLWAVPVFEKMFAHLAPGGTLVTYCAKGQVKRNMKAAGFGVAALPGPPGKREMTRATKPIV